MTADIVPIEDLDNVIGVPRCNRLAFSADLFALAPQAAKPPTVQPRPKQALPEDRLNT